MNCNAKSLDLLCQAIFVETYARDKAQRIFVIKSKEQFDRFTASCLFAGEHVEHLSISGEAGWRATCDDCFCLMLALMRMPRLKRLQLKTPGLHRPIIIATLYTHATALEELHIKMDNLDDPYDPADLLVPQILTSEVGSLRLVHFLGSPPDERDKQPVIPYPQAYVDAVALLLKNSANTIKQLHIRAPHPTQIFARTRHPLQFPNLEVLTMFGTHIDRSPCFMQVQNNVTYLELSLADTDSGPGGFLFNIGLLERLGQCFPSLTTLKLIAQSEDGPDLLGLDQLFSYFLRQAKGLKHIVLSLETFVDDSLPPRKEDLSRVEFAALGLWGCHLPALEKVEFIPRSRRDPFHSWVRPNNSSPWYRRLAKKTSRA